VWLQRHLAPAARSAAFAVSMSGVLGLAAAPAAAQGKPTLTISLPATITTQSATQVPLEIRVGPSSAIPRHSFVRVRGLPPMAALSVGHAIAPGAWAIPLNALSDLKIMMPAGAAGRSDFVATLVANDGSILAAAKSTLVVGPSEQQGQKGEQNPAGAPPEGATILRAGTQLEGREPPARSGNPAPKAASRMTPADRERAERLMTKAEEELELGNISAARLLYERAADVGLAEAAMALGATYDPPELSRLHARGIVPNRNEARRWYQRARELGAEGASAQLQRLGAN
jgi:hypothetical protein